MQERELLRGDYGSLIKTATTVASRELKTFLQANDIEANQQDLCVVVNDIADDMYADVLRIEMYAHHVKECGGRVPAYMKQTSFYKQWLKTADAKRKAEAESDAEIALCVKSKKLFCTLRNPDANEDVVKRAYEDYAKAYASHFAFQIAESIIAKERLKGKVKIEVSFELELPSQKGGMTVVGSEVWKGNKITETDIQEIAKNAIQNASMNVNVKPEDIRLLDVEVQQLPYYDFNYSTIDVHYYFQINEGDECNFATITATDVIIDGSVIGTIADIAKRCKAELAAIKGIDPKNIRQITHQEYKLYNKLSSVQGENEEGACDT